jgi:hypothetical protein
MHFRRLAIIAMIITSASVHGEPKSFNRFTDDLPQILETDALTVLVRAITHDFAGKICSRLGPPVSEKVQTEVAEWRTRNDPFITAAASVINAFGNRYFADGGEPARQEYLHMTKNTTGREANKRLMLQLNGASLNNNVIPPERACLGLANILRDRVGDYERNPEVTRALVPYMERIKQTTMQPNLAVERDASPQSGSRPSP